MQRYALIASLCCAFVAPRELYAAIDPEPQPSLAGQRALVRGSEGVIHVFDRGKGAAIVAPRRRSAEWSILLSLGDRSVTVPFEVEARSAMDLLRAQIAPELRGDGVLTLKDKDRAVSTWHVRLSSLSDDAPRVAAAAALRKERKLDEAIAALREPLASTDGWERLWAEVERGHVAFVAGDRGTTETWWLQAAETARASSVESEAGTRYRGVAFLRTERGEFAAADQALARAIEINRKLDYPLSHAEDQYMDGLIRLRLGEYIAAVRSLRRAASAADQIGDERRRFGATEMLSAALLEVGSYREALSLFEKEPAGLGEQATIRHLVNRAEVTLGAMLAGVKPRDLSMPRRDLERSLQLIERSGVVQNATDATARLAHLSLLEGDIDRASAYLERLENKSDEELSAVRWLVPLLRAEVNIAKKQWLPAEAGLQAVVRRAREERGGDTSEDVCTAMMMLGDVSRARGMPDEAITRYRAALQEVDRLAVRIEVPRAKARFLFKHSRVAASLAELLLKKNQPREALAVLVREQAALLEDLNALVQVSSHGAPWREYQGAREELARMQRKGCASARPSEREACTAQLKNLKNRVDETLERFYEASGARKISLLASSGGADQLAKALGEGEALLAIFRLGERWAVFFLDEKELSFDISEALPKTWIARAERRQHVYVLLGERTDKIEPHLFETRPGHPLAASVSMSYLPSGSSLLRDDPRPNAPALVIGDPDGTLPRAREAAVEVAAHLPGARTLLGDQATRPEVTQALPGSSVVHFIGHASLVDEDPWTTELRLARGESLGVADVLTARASLGLAVLEGCTTGAKPARGEVGLPQAMIVAGARSVLATVRDLRAGEATAFIQRFYDAGGRERPAFALREAVRGSIRANDQAWRAFRLWGRR